MARKRASLKDKNVFKRSRELDALFGSPAHAEEESAAAETPQSDAPAEAAPATTPVTEASRPEPQEDLPVGEAALDELTFDPASLPPALETPPGGPLTEDLPSAEIGDDAPDVDDLFDFPPALETPPGGPLTEDLPSAEIGDDASAIDGTLNFPPALETAPSGEAAPADALPADDIDMALFNSVLAEDPAPVASASVTPPPAGSSPAADIASHESGLDFEPATTPPPAIPARPVAPPAPRPAVSAGAEGAAGGPGFVSRATPLTFSGADMADDFFDFTRFDREAPTASFELPANIDILTPEERKERAKLLQDPRIREQFMQVYNAIDAEYEHILNDNVSVSREITDWAHKLLAETRYIIMNYQLEYLAKAEWNIEQVRARLDRAEESTHYSQKWSWRLLVWGMAWFVIFVYLIFKPDYLSLFLKSNNAISDLLVVEIFLRTIFFGGIGGVAAIFHNLLRYVTKRTFDTEYILSYFAKPFMGMIVGTLVYLIVFVVMRPFQITPEVLQNTAAGSDTSRFVFEVLSYFMATAAGFKENLVFDLMNKVMKIIFRDAPSQSDVVPPPPPPGPFSAGSTS